MFRFFACDKQGNLSNSDIHHLINVARVKIGDCFELVLYSKQVSICKLTSLNPFTYLEIEKDICNHELDKNVTLLFALSKGDKNDFVIQKACELGANRIVLCPSERSVVKYDTKQIGKKIERYQSIAKEAAMQSHREVMPEIVLLERFTDIFTLDGDLKLVAYEKAEYNDIKSLNEVKNYKNIIIYVGSEGGISDNEYQLFLSHNFTPLSLGKRILRAETAAVYCLSVISYLLEK